MKKIILILSSMLLAVFAATAQSQGTGIGTISPDASAQLDVSSTNKGLLPPRMTTTQRDAISNPAIGLMVFNTDSKCSEVFLGIGASGAGSTGWKNLCKANINATFTSATLNCAVANSLYGDYVATVPMAAANYKIVTVTTLSAGDYSVTTDEQNGVKFSADGTIASVGSGTQLTLQASGTPVNAGTFTYTVSLSGQTCTFSVTYANPPAPILNGQVNCSGSASGTYITNTAATAANTVSLTVTPTGIGYYNYSAGPLNGLTFSATGTFVSGDVGSLKTITLTASGNPVAAGTFNYTVSGTSVSSGCTFSVAVAKEKQFLTATLNTTGSINSANTYFTYTGVVASPNGITISGDAITLKAGKTYYLEANVRALSSSGFLSYEFVDASNNRLAGTSRAISINSSQSSTPAAGFYTVGASDVVVKLKVATFSNVATYSDVNGTGSLVIKEIGSSTGYLAANGPSTSQNLGTAGDFTWGSALASNGGVNVSGGSITLKANKVYRLYAAIRAVGSGTYVNYYFANTSNTRLTGTSVGLAITPGYAQSSVPAVGIYAVGASDEVVKLRIAPGSGASLSYNDANGSCVLIVEELPGTAFMAATVTDGQSASSVAANLSYNTPTRSNGGLAISGQNITLKAGKVYRICQYIRLAGSSNSSYFGFTLANSSNSNLTGINLGGSYAQDNSQNTVPSYGFYRVGGNDEIIKFKVTGTSGNSAMFSQSNGESPLVIDEVY